MGAAEGARAVDKERAAGHAYCAGAFDAAAGDRDISGAVKGTRNRKICRHNKGVRTYIQRAACNVEIIYCPGLVQGYRLRAQACYPDVIEF